MPEEKAEEKKKPLIEAPRFATHNKRAKDPQHDLPMYDVLVKYLHKGKTVREQTIQVSEDVALIYKRKIEVDGNVMFIKVTKAKKAS